MPTQNIGLDGVVTQQENYKRSGFKLAYRNIRYEGVGIDDEISDPNIIPLSRVPIDKLLQYDRQVFPTNREVFLKKWIKQPESLTLACLKNNNLLGYGMVRK